MGAWSYESFGNDTACDWAGGFLDDPKIAKLTSAIAIVNTCDDYLENDQSCECIAACEVIARLKGKHGIKDAYSEGIDEWTRSNKISIDEKTIQAAILALKRITTDESELNELWQESDEYDNWKNAVDDLAKRVGG